MDQLIITNSKVGRTPIAVALFLSIILLCTTAFAQPLSLECTIDTSGEVHKMVVDIDSESVKHDIGFDAPLTLYSSASEITVPLNVSEEELSYAFQMEPGGVDYIHTYKIMRDDLSLTHSQSYRLDSQVSVSTYQGACVVVEVES